MEELLLSVQNDVNTAEKQLFGKVFDLQSERNFLARHQQLVSENDELKDGMDGLNEKIAELSTQLDKMQRQFVATKHLQQKAERHLKEQVTENDFTIEGLQKELRGSDLVLKDNDRLMDLKRALTNESVEITAVASAAEKELREAKAELHKEEGMIQPKLQKQLVSQHAYGVGCHVKVHQLDMQLRAVLAAQPLQSSAEKATAMHDKKSHEAVDQRMAIENQFLKQQVAHAQAELTGLQEQDRTALAKLNELQLEIKAEKAAVLQAMGNLKTQITNEQEALDQNINTRKQKESALIIELDILAELQQKSSVKGMEMLRAENAKLKVLLSTRKGKLQASQGKEAEAKALEQEKMAENAALQTTAHNSFVKAEETMVEAQKQVAEAADESAKTQDKAKDLTEQAEAAVAAKCKPDWDKRKSKADKKMEKCRVWQDDLMSANAEIDTLKVSLEAAGLHMPAS